MGQLPLPSFSHAPEVDPQHERTVGHGLPITPSTWLASQWVWGKRYRPTQEYEMSDDSPVTK